MASFRKSHHIFFLPPVEAAEVIIVTCVFSAAKMEEKLFKDLEKKEKQILLLMYFTKHRINQNRTECLFVLIHLCHFEQMYLVFLKICYL